MFLGGKLNPTRLHKIEQSNILTRLHILLISKLHLQLKKEDSKLIVRNTNQSNNEVLLINFRKHNHG